MLREMEQRRARVQIDHSLLLLKTMIDAAIARGEKKISSDIADYIKENADAPVHVGRVSKRRN